MEETKIIQDFDEFEMLLSEIPNATSGSPQSVIPIRPNSNSSAKVEPISKGKISLCCGGSAKLNNSLRAPGHVGDTTSYDGSTLSRCKCDRKDSLHDENGKSQLCLERETANLPDDQSLASAFGELTFKDSIAVLPAVSFMQTPHSVNGTNIASGLNSVEMSFPQLNTIANSTYSPYHDLERQSSLRGRNEERQFDQKFLMLNNNETNMRYSESLACNFQDHSQRFPIHPVNSEMRCFEILPGVSNRQFELPASNVQHRLYFPKQQYVYVQQFQNQGSNVQQMHNQMGQGMQASYWNNPVVNRGSNQLAATLMNSDTCRYNPHNFCGLGESYTIRRGEKINYPPSLTCSARGFSENQSINTVDEKNFPAKILMRSNGANSLRTIRSGSLITSQSQHHVLNNAGVYTNGNTHLPLTMRPNSTQLNGQKLQFLPCVNFESVDEIAGRIYSFAKDQNGCRSLQKVFTEGTPEDVEKVFNEIICRIVDLMTDPFANYLVQKLLEVCTQSQMMRIVQEITKVSGDLVLISCNTHGTRSLQKLIETIKSEEQISMVVSALRPDILSLMMDANGSHVAQCCLQYLLPEYIAFIFDAAITYCFDLAKDRYGCCVLQKCIFHSSGEKRRQLISAVISNALCLSQDQYGNYVVQIILDQEIPWATDAILDQLQGRFGDLSMQKYSSNVVEKCLKLARDIGRAKIIRELMNSYDLPQIMLDQYGNYVIQSALRECKGALHAAFVEVIKPHAAVLRTSPFGRRVLSCPSLKNK
uniref:PUM-HD domain-containing protein n=1 Tax=Ananas comosus var. bracteatus TaxID=296719 RepID=A0A6V7QYC8_ANACO